MKKNTLFRLNQRYPIALKRFKKSCAFYKSLQVKLQFSIQNLDVQHILLPDKAFFLICFEFHRCVSATSANAYNNLKADFDFSWGEWPCALSIF